MWWENSNLLYAARDELYMGGIKMSSIARTRGTPIYVYNLDIIRSNFQRLKDAIEGAGFVDFTINYAMKANNNPIILKFIRSLEGCVDTTSPGEIELAKKYGFDNDQIVFTGTSLSEKDIIYLNESGVFVNYDSISSIRRAASSAGRKVGLRINPGVGIGRTNKISTGGSYSGSIPVKFGLPTNMIDRAITECDEKKYTISCLHQHLGSDWLGDSVDDYYRALDELIILVEKINRHKQHKIESINLGGGFGVPHSASESEFPVNIFFREVRSRIIKAGLDSCRLIVEPGNYIVSNSGLLLVTVNTVENKSGHIFVGVDAGLNVFNSPAYYGIYHEIIGCTESKENTCEQKINVVGNICETADFFAIERIMPTPKEGDILAILNVGAYGATLSSNYNLRNKADEVVIQSGAIVTN